MVKAVGKATLPIQNRRLFCSVGAIVLLAIVALSQLFHPCSNAPSTNSHAPRQRVATTVQHLPSPCNYSLCGSLPLSAVASLIQDHMVYHKRRWEYTQHDWALAVAWLRQHQSAQVQRLCDGHQQKMRILMYFGSMVHVGLTGLNGTPQGEQIQWHDLFIALLLTGYHPVMESKRKHLEAAFLDSFDLVITDYNGIHHGFDKSWLQHSENKCKLRVLDSWGTAPSYNMKQHGGPYCCLQLPSLRQFWTFTPAHAPENDFLGYTVRSFRPAEEFEPPAAEKQQRRLEIVLYAKEFQFLQDHTAYIQQLVDFAPTHATAMGWPQGTLPAVRNHGVLEHKELHALMTDTFAYAGFPAVMMGPAAMESISQGMVFLNYAFDPPWNLSQKMGKPSTQLWTSQFPFLEDFEPHAVTINPADKADVAAKLARVKETYNKWWRQAKYKRVGPDDQVNGHVFLARTRGHRSGFVPHEYTTVAMLLRMHQLVRLNVCRVQQQQA